MRKLDTQNLKIVAARRGGLTSVSLYNNGKLKIASENCRFFEFFFEKLRFFTFILRPTWKKFDTLNVNILAARLKRGFKLRFPHCKKCHKNSGFRSFVTETPFLIFIYFFKNVPHKTVFDDKFCEHNNCKF